MDSQPDCLSCAAQAHDTGDQREKEAPVAHVDPFLVEALQNPRHRLTVLRMELDIQRFMQKTEQQQFEFQHFPTSYLRLAAHRVAQHYGLHSMVLDNGLDTSRTRIIVQKTAASQLPFVCLSEIPAKQPENEKTELVKIAIKTRPQRTSSGDATELGLDKSPVRTVDQRMEEYDKVRARIFSGSSGSDLEGVSSPIDGRSPWQSREESKNYWNMNCEVEKSTTGGSSRVAIFRDREKDRSDPDYDRSYDRYVRSLSPNQNFGGGGPFTMVQPSFIQYETCFPQFGQLPVLQTPTKYQHSNPIMTPFGTIQTNQTSRGVGQMHWPCPSMMYAHSYQNFRQGIFQAPLYQQPLSFEYLQNH